MQPTGEEGGGCCIHRDVMGRENNQAFVCCTSSSPLRMANPDPPAFPPHRTFPHHPPGRIDAGDLLVALRALGFEPRKDEVKKLMSDNDKDNTGTITKQQFVEIFRAKWVRTICLPC